MNIRDKSTKFDFAVGGQAVIEGVMMRSPNFTIVSVRSPADEIKVLEKHYVQLGRRIKALGLPFLRGVINLFEMMYIGIVALNFSSKQALNEGEETKQSESMENIMLFGTILFSLAFSIFLFKFLPLLVTQMLSGFVPGMDSNYLVYNLVDGVLKTGIFVAYLLLLSLFPDVKRVFMYHGAEHKSIMNYESGQELSVENARNKSRFHPRCGTSFILIVFFISIVVYTLLPRVAAFEMNFLLRVALLPVIASISYELLKISAKHHNSAFFKIITWPGLMMQRLTTKEPTDDMLEVALNSLKLALQKEQAYGTKDLI